MKKYIIIAFLSTPLHAAAPKALPPILDGPPLYSLLDKHSDVRTMRQFKKTGATAVVTLGAYGLSKTDIAHQMFPQIFPRSGTSTVIIAVLGAIAGSGGIWVLRDKFEEWGLRQKATEDMLRSGEMLEQLLPVIKEVQDNQAELESNIQKWKPKIAQALNNSVAAREGYESVLTSLTTIVKDMGDDKTALGQITQLKDQIDGIEQALTKVHQNLGKTTALANETALAHLRDKTENSPSIDALSQMADDLASTSKRFAQVPQQPDTSERKRKWWRH